MKEVVYLTNNLGVGGSQKVLLTLAHEAANCGYRVTIISLCSNLLLVDKLKSNDNFRIIVCSSHNSTNGIRNRFYITFNLFKYFIINKPFLIHSHLWQIDIVYLIFLKLLYPNRIIHTIHSPGSSYLKRNYFDFINNKIESIFIKSFKGVYVTIVSIEIAEVIKRVLNYDKQSFLISNGILLPNCVGKSSSFDMQKTKKIIYPARFQQSKGHIILLSAIKKLIACNFNVQLILIGTELKENLLEEIERLDLIDNVVILDPVSNIESVLCSSDFGVFPSLYEGHSIALSEMMAVGLPIVATNIDSNIMVTENGKGALMCLPNSVDSLFENLKKLLMDNDLAKLLGTNAREIAERRFSSKVMFKKYSELYNLDDEFSS